MKKISCVLTFVFCVLFLVACNNNTDSSHIHDYTIVSYNENAHWLECECKDKTAVEFHRGGTATCVDLAVCSICLIEYGKLESHNYVDGICSKCNSVDPNGTNTNENGINEAVWNSMLDINNFENFTVKFYDIKTKTYVESTMRVVANSMTCGLKSGSSKLASVDGVYNVAFTLEEFA